MKKLCTIIVVTLLGLCALGAPAAAGGSLVSSTPPAGARLTKAPDSVRLVFDRPVLGGGATVVTVTGPDGKQESSGPMGVDGKVVTALLPPLGPDGEYVVGYEVDLGDPVSLAGQLRFTLAKPGQAADTGTSWQTWAWLGAILVVIAAATTAAGVAQARARR